MTEIWQKKKMTENVKVDKRLKILDKAGQWLDRLLALIRRGSEVQVLPSAPGLLSLSRFVKILFLPFLPLFRVCFGRKLAECIFIIVTISACNKGYPIHIQNVTNFAREINPGFIVEKEWVLLLKKQPVISGHQKPTFEAIKRINDNCNNKAYKPDPKWPTPREFTEAKTADCKGFAICKYYALRAVGFSANQLNLWSGDYDGHPHLILVVKLDDKQYVLDIGAEANLPEAKDYFYKRFQPAYRFNENGWDIN
jgi:predicted transglutaminase-like cysteine proteinase